MYLKQDYIRLDRCTRCQRCLAVCPAQAIGLTQADAPLIQNLKCNRCGACKNFRTQKAISRQVRLQF